MSGEIEFKRGKTVDIEMREATLQKLFQSQPLVAMLVDVADLAAPRVVATSHVHLDGFRARDLGFAHEASGHRRMTAHLMSASGPREKVGVLEGIIRFSLRRDVGSDIAVADSVAQAVWNDPEQALDKAPIRGGINSGKGINSKGINGGNAIIPPARTGVASPIEPTTPVRDRKTTREIKLKSRRLAWDEEESPAMDKSISAAVSRPLPEPRALAKSRPGKPRSAITKGPAPLPSRGMTNGQLPNGHLPNEKLPNEQPLVVVKPTVANPETEQEAKGRELVPTARSQIAQPPMLYFRKTAEEYQEIDTPLGWLVDTDSAAPMAAAKTAATTTASASTQPVQTGMQPRMLPMMDPGGRVPGPDEGTLPWDAGDPYTARAFAAIKLWFESKIGKDKLKGLLKTTAKPPSTITAPAAEKPSESEKPIKKSAKAAKATTPKRSKQKKRPASKRKPKTGRSTSTRVPQRRKAAWTRPRTGITRGASSATRRKTSVAPRNDKRNTKQRTKPKTPVKLRKSPAKLGKPPAKMRKSPAKPAAVSPAPPSQVKQPKPQQQQRPVLRVGSQVNLVGGRFDGRPAIIREWLGPPRSRWGVELTGADPMINGLKMAVLPTDLVASGTAGEGATAAALEPTPNVNPKPISIPTFAVGDPVEALLTKGPGAGSWVPARVESVQNVDGVVTHTLLIRSSTISERVGMAGLTFHGVPQASMREPGVPANAINNDTMKNGAEKDSKVPLGYPQASASPTRRSGPSPRFDNDAMLLSLSKEVAYLRGSLEGMKSANGGLRLASANSEVVTQSMTQSMTASKAASLRATDLGGLVRVVGVPFLRAGWFLRRAFQDCGAYKIISMSTDSDSGPGPRAARVAYIRFETSSGAAAACAIDLSKYDGFRQTTETSGVVPFATHATETDMERALAENVASTSESATAEPAARPDPVYLAMEAAALAGHVKEPFVECWQAGRMVFRTEARPTRAARGDATGSVVWPRARVPGGLLKAAPASPVLIQLWDAENLDKEFVGTVAVDAQRLLSGNAFDVELLDRNQVVGGFGRLRVRAHRSASEASEASEVRETVKLGVREGRSIGEIKVNGTRLDVTPDRLDGKAQINGRQDDAGAAGPASDELDVTIPRNYEADFVDEDAGDSKDDVGDTDSLAATQPVSRQDSAPAAAAAQPASAQPTSTQATPAQVDGYSIRDSVEYFDPDTKSWLSAIVVDKFPDDTYEVELTGAEEGTVYCVAQDIRAPAGAARPVAAMSGPSMEASTEALAGGSRPRVDVGQDELEADLEIELEDEDGDLEITFEDAGLDADDAGGITAASAGIDFGEIDEVDEDVVVDDAVDDYSDEF